MRFLQSDNNKTAYVIWLQNMNIYSHLFPITISSQKWKTLLLLIIVNVIQILLINVFFEYYPYYCKGQYVIDSIKVLLQNLTISVTHIDNILTWNVCYIHKNCNTTALTANCVCLPWKTIVVSNLIFLFVITALSRVLDRWTIQDS